MKHMGEGQMILMKLENTVLIIQIGLFSNSDIGYSVVSNIQKIVTPLTGFTFTC